MEELLITVTSLFTGMSGFYTDIYQFANIELPWLAKYTTDRSRGYSAPKNDSYLKFCHESSLANATKQVRR